MRKRNDMVEQGLKFEEKNGIIYIHGILNEYADFSSLLQEKEPLRLNLQGLKRLNSIGIRNLLKFLVSWGEKSFSYEDCPSEFIDQINMIPALLGVKKHAKIISLFILYECIDCDLETEVLTKISDCKEAPDGGYNAPTVNCPTCSKAMTLVTDSFFNFRIS